MKIDTKLYPSPENVQNSNAFEVPLGWAIAYLTKLQGSIPADERESAVVRGWSSLAVHYQHQLSEMEVLKSKLDALRNALVSAPREGLTGEDIEKLKALL